MSVAEPPVAWIRLRMSFHAVSALVRTVSKAKPDCSALRLACALARLTKEMPTFICTTALPVVSKLSQPPELTPLALLDPLLMVPPSQVPKELGARSNWANQKIGYVFEEPQKPPPVKVPLAVEPLMLIDPLRLPVALRLVLMSTLAVVEAG